MNNDYERNSDTREIRLETNPLEDALWLFTLGKFGLKVIALVIFFIIALVKILSK